MYVGLHIKCILFLFDFTLNRYFSNFSIHAKYEISRKSVRYESSWYKRTDRHKTKLVVTFRISRHVKMRLSRTGGGESGVGLD